MESKLHFFLLFINLSLSIRTERHEHITGNMAPAKKRGKTGSGASADAQAGGNKNGRDLLTASGTAIAGADLIPELRVRLSERADEVLKTHLPDMVKKLDGIMRGEGETQLFVLGNAQAVRAESLRSLAVLDVHQAVESADGNEDAGKAAPLKKRKLGADDAVADDTVAPDQSNGLASVATHQILVEMSGVLSRELADLIDMFSSVKVWIQMNIPKIEDGNNFGVGIQEEAISELQRAEESAFGVLGNITKYHAMRAKLVSKVAKYPGILDYHRSVVELDQKEFVAVRTSLTDHRNIAATVVDMIQKNLDKIVLPREAHTSMGMY